MKSHPFNFEVKAQRHAPAPPSSVQPVNPDGTPWWFGKSRGSEWAKALADQQPRLTSSSFGKSHRMAFGPNVVPDEAESKFRRSRNELLAQVQRVRRAS